MQLAGALLKFEYAPLDPREVELGVRFQDSKKAHKTRDLNLLLQLVEASLEHTIASGLS